MGKNKIDWNKVAKQYDTYTVGGFNPAYFELMDFARARLDDIEPGSVVCDIGGGTANFSIMFADRFPESNFVVLDDSPQMMEIGFEKARKKGLDNVEFIEGDAEDLGKVVSKFQKPITHAIMVHALYTTGGYQDEKPNRVLKNIYENLDGKDSRFLLIDLNRPFDTNDWIKYSIKNAYNKFRSEDYGPISSAYKVARLFMENDQAKWVNRELDRKQKTNEFLLCDLNQLEHMVLDAGFSKIYESTDTLYRGRDNAILAGK